jgi:uncharacterized protein (DUF1800 family)
VTSPSISGAGDTATRATLPREKPTSAPLPAPAAVSMSVLASAALAACGGGGGSDTPPATTPAPSPAPAPATGLKFPKAENDNDAASFLQQAQFSSTKAEIAQLRATTYAGWLQEQFSKPPSITAVQWLYDKGYVGENLKFLNSNGSANHVLWHQLMATPDAMRKRFALALSEYFVVSLTGLSGWWSHFAAAQYWDILTRLTYGTFRQLLEEITLNPAMGIYLNTQGNRGENEAGRVPDENYAREVMQLFTIGLYKLNLDGSVVVSNGKPVDSYSQDDITNLARVFTGYKYNTANLTRIDQVRDTGVASVWPPEFVIQPMAFFPADHSKSDANFLGASAPASLSGAERMRIALDTLANHPNVGPFFAKQMIQRLITSNPSPAYVERVAKAFNDNGKGVRGDLKAVWSAILLDDEARNPANAASNTHGKLREPMVRFIQWGRSFGFQSTAGTWKLGSTSADSTQLGQSPMRAPSVFNFFRPGFVPPNTPLAASKTPAPEFQITNETSVAGYLNFMQTTIRNGFSVRAPTLPDNGPDPATPLVNDMLASYTDELALVNDATALINHLNTVLCAGRITAANATLMINALNANTITATSTDAQKRDRIANAIFMVMACSDYLIQK